MTYVRLLHAIPNAPAVDVYLNEDLVVEGLAYSKFTSYLTVEPGDYVVEIFPTGTGDMPLIRTELSLPDKKIFTVAAIGLPTSSSLYPIEDPMIQLEKGKLGLRFGHLSPDAPPVDIQTDNGDILFNNVSYKQVTDYQILDPETYTVNVVPTGTNNSVLMVPNVKLRKNRFYSIYAIGLVGDQPYLQVVIPLDGNSYLTFLNGTGLT